jgi:glyoxylase-like metal-dependent hydrolase (beta-lactamase superfamily II)
MSKLSYDVFINNRPPQNDLLPNGEPKRFSPVANTLMYGSENAALTDPAFTTDQARVLGDWVAAKNRRLTDIFITHSHGDHWSAAGLLAERLGPGSSPARQRSCRCTATLLPVRSFGTKYSQGSRPSWRSRPARSSPNEIRSKKRRLE